MQRWIKNFENLKSHRFFNKFVIFNTVTAINARFHTIALDKSSSSISLSLESFRSGFLVGDIFLAVDTQLYRRLCSSVHWSVDTNQKVLKRAFQYFSCMRAKGVDGGWMPLPTIRNDFVTPGCLLSHHQPRRTSFMTFHCQLHWFVVGVSAIP